MAELTVWVSLKILAIGIYKTRDDEPQDDREMATHNHQ